MLNAPHHRDRSDELDAFYRQQSTRLRRAVRKYGAAEVVDDACAEAWLILARRDDIALDEGGASWLTTVAIRCSWRMARAEQLRVIPGLDPTGPDHDPEARAIERDEFRVRVIYVRRLKPRQRRDVYLHALGFTYREIGEITGCSERTVMRDLTEGRAALRVMTRRSA